MKAPLASVALRCAALAAPIASTIRFEEIAQKSGLVFTCDSSPTPNENQLCRNNRDGTFMEVPVRAHLGGVMLAKEIDIVWPSGIHQTLHAVPADRILTVTEKAGETVGGGSAAGRRK